MNTESHLIFLFAVIGLIFGSFATAAIYRLPRGINLVSGRSACSSCNNKLNVVDLVPLFSWVLSGGKCRHCKNSVSFFYPAVEVVTAVLFVLTYLQFGLTLESVIICLVCLLAVILTVIDFEHYIIPDSINASFFILAVIYRILHEAEPYTFFVVPLIGLSIGYALRWFMFAWKKKEGLGMGDVKFLPSVALFLNSWELALAYMLLCGVSGIIIAIFWRIIGKGKRFPFGPSLVMALLICLFFPGVGEEFITMTNGIMEKIIAP